MERLALVFVPGISDLGIDQSAMGLATRIANGLDTSVRADEEGRRSATFQTTDRGAIRYNENRTASVASVTRVENNIVLSTLDIYRADFVREKIDADMNKPTWVRMIHVLLTVFLILPRLVNLFRSSIGTARTAIAALWALLILSILSLHFILLFITVFMSVLQAIPNVEEQFSFISHIPGWNDSIVPMTAGILILLNTAVLPLLPLRLRRAVAESASGWIVMLNYLSGAARTSTCTRAVSTLVEELENNEDGYDGYYVVGYSFGSIVTLDTAFGTGKDAIDQSMKLVKGIGTIGCPYACINVFWKKHFTGRSDSHALSSNWCNIFIKGDPISSQFLSKDGDPAGLIDREEKTIAPASEFSSQDWNEIVRVGVFHQVLLQGIRLHMRYWSDEVGDPGCWSILAWQLLQKTKMVMGGVK